MIGIRSFLFLIFIFLAKSSIAQLYQHYTFRSNVSIEKKLFTNSFIILEYQHRRQDNPAFEKYNIFRYQYQQSSRIWYRYEYADKIELTVSPFAYFKTWKLLTQNDFIPEVIRKELRFSMQGEFFQAIEKFRFQCRNIYEYRIFFQTKNSNEIGRLRTRLQIQYQVTEPLRLNFFNEFFFNTIPNQGTNYFKENRIGFLLTHTYGKFALEMGYVYIYKQRNSPLELDIENGLTVGVIYKMP
jgi:hypothetical protein